LDYKCSLHKSNEGFINEAGEWICWFCYNEEPMDVINNEYLALMSYPRSLLDEDYYEEEVDDGIEERFYYKLYRIDIQPEVFLVIASQETVYLDEYNNIQDTESISWECKKFKTESSARRYFDKIKES